MKKLLKIALMCFVFTFAIFGVACGEENSTGANDPDYSTEEPASPEDNTPPDDNTSDDDDNTSDNDNSNTDPELPSDGGNETHLMKLIQHLLRITLILTKKSQLIQTFNLQLKLTNIFQNWLKMDLKL